jgi:membrane-bound serine protease (ClpP class)
MLVLFFLLLSPAPAENKGATGPIFIIDLEGIIFPGSALYLERGIDKARDLNASLIVVKLDTPGGLATSMRSMVKAILNSSVPVAVYVGPRGAGAASAGVMVTIAGHIAAMAPGTNIGAAHPVSALGKDIEGEMSKKVVNDMASYGRGIANDKGRNGEWVEKAIRESVSITADEALEKNVIDLIAQDIDDLITQLHGKEITVLGQKVVLDTADKRKITYELGFRDRVLKALSDPQIAILLLLLGAAGLYFEFTNPGAIFPGVIGAFALILAIFALRALPVNYVGLMLIVLSFVLFIMEVKVTSYGLLSVGGLISLTLGCIMLFEGISISLSFLIPVVVFVGGFFILVAGLAFRAHSVRPRGGADGIIGETGIVKERIEKEGLIFVHGELWRARADEVIEPEEEVEVVELKGLILEVKRK